MKNQMQIIYKKDPDFTKFWEEFLSQNPSSYKYKLEFLEFLKTYNQISKDLSFVVKSHEILGICPLFLLENNTSLMSPAPLSKNEKAQKLIFTHLETLANEHNFKKLSFYIDPLMKPDFNFLKLYGYVEKNTLDCIINLKNDKEILWQNLRSRYKTQINKTLKTTTLKVINHQNQNQEIFELFRLLHKKIAGINTKPKPFFDYIYGLLTQNLITLLALCKDDEYLGFCLFFHDENSLSYAIGVNEKLELAISHTLLYHAMLYFKDKGYKALQLGQPCNFSKACGLDDYATPKQIDISHFKKGMGGTLTSFFRGTRYYDKALLEADLQTLKENYE